MSKHKLQRFAELPKLERTFQFPFPLLQTEHGLKGNWGKNIFHNDHPIVLELGCGRGEYTVELARQYPDLNFIGVDIKGARLWRGAKTITEEKILNAAFLRVQIEWIGQFFDKGEVSEIWITFPDPQPQLSRENRRLTNEKFLSLYKLILTEKGMLHLKTDNRGFFEYTLEMLESQSGKLEICTFDLYNDTPENFNLAIQTTYEKKFLAKGLPIHYLRYHFDGLK